MRWLTASGPQDLSIPLYLGILNVTPDSFSDGGCFSQPCEALEHAQALLAQGARMVDLGAESTRPGAIALSEAQEWSRLEPVLNLFGQELSAIPLSLDTRHVSPARRGLEQGVSVLNDITGFSDPAMLGLVSKGSCGLIAMRSRFREGALFMPDYGSEGLPGPEAAIHELGQVRDRLMRAGIDPERILLDPGFGFGTTFGEDLALWRALPDLPSRLNWPVERFCIGVSRKRFLAWRTDRPNLPAAERDGLTCQAHQEALGHGFRVFRTHAISPIQPSPPICNTSS